MAPGSYLRRVLQLEELCNTENQQKESFKQRLIASNAAEAELLTQLDFAIKVSEPLSCAWGYVHLLRACLCPVCH